MFAKNVNNKNTGDHHNTSTHSSTSLSEKLAGVAGPDKTSDIIRLHAEAMTRPSPPPKDTSPVPTPPSSLKKTFMFVQHGIRHQNKCVQKFNYILCSETFVTQKELNAHIKSAHTGFKFTCRYCKCKYESANGCFKHEKSHARYDYECEFCHKYFQFPKALKGHWKVHTGKLKYSCTSCTNSYTTNRAMPNHSLKHQGKLYKCDKCAKQCDLPYNLAQHTHGYHGDGWLMPCGAREQ